MLKTLMAISLLISTNISFADINKDQALCEKDKLSYSLGSVVKDKEEKFYICVVAYEKNMEKKVAWVEVESDSKTISKNSFNLKK